ncbi:hypothetical protein F4679DRAFT_245078 [Xylaria curta]|nr:hypothetical protein F4679DRAFT_245078 [Xylaria curta]
MAIKQSSNQRSFLVRQYLTSTFFCWHTAFSLAPCPYLANAVLTCQSICLFPICVSARGCFARRLFCASFRKSDRTSLIHGDHRRTAHSRPSTSDWLCCVVLCCIFRCSVAVLRISHISYRLPTYLFHIFSSTYTAWAFLRSTLLDNTLLPCLVGQLV